jgi:predicted ribosomally synthesized peptide with SipW-like signal peptide
MSDNDNSGFDLTRRKVLGGLVGVGAASAAAGAGTMALFSDTEQSTGNTIQAGTLDLEIGTSQNLPVNVSDRAPGHEGSGSVEVRNVGSIGGHLSAAITNVGGGEGDNPESETDTSGSGDLADHVHVAVGFDRDGDLSTTDDQETVIPTQPVSQAERHGAFLGLHDLGGTSGTNTSNLYLKWWLDSCVGNEVQGDHLTFDIEVGLQQSDRLVVGSGGGYSSIQAAIDDASAPDRIEIESESFQEQVVVDKKLLLKGNGPGQTTIKSPASLSESFKAGGSDSSDTDYPVVLVGGEGAQIRGLTVDGARNAGNNMHFVGVGVDDVSASLINAEVTNVMEDPFSGNQHGEGIFAHANSGTSRTVTIHNVDIHDYQKGGITAEGDDLSITVADTSVTGTGETDVIAQNGIQYSGGASGRVARTRVTDHHYSPEDWAATGLLIYNGGTVDIFHSDIKSNEYGIYETGSDVSANQNNIANSVAYGVYGETTVDATENWWSHRSGPSGGVTSPAGNTADGSGDEINNNVKFEPVLTTPVPDFNSC